jgi:hypothetical protein
MVGLWDLIRLVRVVVRKKGNSGTFQFHHNPHPKTSSHPSQNNCLDREKNRVRRQVKSLVRNQVGSLVRSLVKSLTPSLSPDQYVSIVSFVKRIVTRESFAIREGERREWLRCGQIRTSTTLLMVCLSLICHCPRERVLCVRFRLGKKIVLWEKRTLLEELNRPDRFGNRSNRFGGSRGTRLVFLPVMSLDLVQEVVVLAVGLESLQMVSLLDVLHLVINMSLGEVAVLSLKGATDHAFLFVVLVLLQ